MNDFTLQLISLAKSSGFTYCAAADTDSVVTEPVLRDYCAQNSCNCYKRNWMCPPAVGTPEECVAKIRRFKSGILLQTVGTLEDSFDFEGMMLHQENHNKNTARFIAEMRKLYNGEIMPLAAGACKICPECAILTNEPCRFPDEAFPSMESYTIDVAKTVAANGLKYINGKDTVTYVSMVFYG